MSNPTRPARLNRLLLLFVSAVLLAGGAFLLMTASGLLPGLLPGAAILSTTPSLAGWAPWMAAAAAVLLGLACLRWLLAQTLRRAKTTTWQYGTDPRQGTTRLDAETATAPLIEEIQTYPGVHRARARLAGTRTHPVLHLLVATENRADIGELRHRIDADAIPRMRQALELDHLDADLLLRLDDARSARTH